MALSVEGEYASSGDCSVTGYGAEEKHSTRRKVRVAVEMEAGAAVDEGWQKAAEDQPEPCPFPASTGRQELELYRARRCRFGLGKKNYLERRKPVLECESSSNRDNGVSGVQRLATSP